MTNVFQSKWQNLKSLIRRKTILRAAAITRNQAIVLWNGDVLDVGCGPGYNWREIWDRLKKQKMNSYLGIDIDKKFLEEFKDKLKRIPQEYRKKIKLELRDIMDFDSERMFDTISMLFTYNHITGLDRALKRMKSILKSKGCLVLVEHVEEDCPSKLWNTFFRFGDSLLKVGPDFEAAGHIRFSKVADVVRKLEEHGFKVEETYYLARTWFIKATTN